MTIKLLVSLSVLQYLRKKRNSCYSYCWEELTEQKLNVFVKMSHANEMRNKRVKWFASFSKSHNSS